LQVFRGFAALAVVTYHAAASTAAFVGALPEPLAKFLGMGLLGVDFFFVLSGFIIMHSHMDDAKTPTALNRYAFRRLSRIYPAYLPVGLGMIFLYAAMPSLSDSGGRDYSLISSLLLVPGEGKPALSLAWTLVHEMMFYGVFLFFFLSWRWLAVSLFAWAAAILLANHLYTPTGWSRYPLSLLNIEFMLGVGAARMVRSKISNGKGTWFAGFGVAIAFVAIYLFMQDKKIYLQLLLAFGLALMVVGFALHEQKVQVRWPAMLLMAGNASYSIYLVHSPLLSFTQRVAGRLGLTWQSAMVSGVVLGVLAGYFYYLVVERPALRFFQVRLRSK
jgi:peptidoglycan/LPS O-acetylase OafA/YrhL